MRRYSVLCSDESIMIEHEGKKYFLRIVEVKPAGAISILGNVDLSVDFSCNTVARLVRYASIYIDLPVENSYTREQSAYESRFI